MTPARMPYLIHDARRSIARGMFTRHRAGSDRVEQLRERAERADTAAVHAAPEHGRDERDRREQIPGEVVAEDRQVAAEQAEHVDDRNQLALVEAEEERLRRRASRI